MKQVIFCLLIGSVVGVMAEIAWGVVAAVNTTTETWDVVTKSGIMLVLWLVCLLSVKQKTVRKIAVPIILVLGGIWIGMTFIYRTLLLLS